MNNSHITQTCSTILVADYLKTFVAVSYKEIYAKELSATCSTKIMTNRQDQPTDSEINSCVMTWKNNYQQPLKHFRNYITHVWEGGTQQLVAMEDFYSFKKQWE